jgi:hypothetical protein
LAMLPAQIGIGKENNLLPPVTMEEAEAVIA